jgi:hypothetical protein
MKVIEVIFNNLFHNFRKTHRTSIAKISYLVRLGKIIFITNFHWNLAYCRVQAPLHLSLVSPRNISLK